jgi:hypothetical protein
LYRHHIKDMDFISGKHAFIFSFLLIAFLLGIDD